MNSKNPNNVTYENLKEAGVYRNLFDEKSF